VKLNDLKPARGSKKSRRRVGRGLGSGRGKTAGRGQKGQKSRSGFSQGAGWEGGRSRLIMRLPKRGFNRDRTPMQIVNIDDLNRFEAGTTVDATLLVEHGLVRRADRPVKLLGEGELEVRDLTIALDAWSRGALAAVRSAGGTVLGADESEALAAKAAPVETEAPAVATEAAAASEGSVEAAAEGSGDEGSAVSADEDEERA
jgi:large subunit ribosomal protein L15